MSQALRSSLAVAAIALAALSGNAFSRERTQESAFSNDAIIVAALPMAFHAAKARVASSLRTEPIGFGSAQTFGTAFAMGSQINQSFWLSPNGAWTTFLHKRWDGRSTTPLATNVPYETYPINFPDSLQGYWRFQVYVQYGWYTTTGWAQTQGIKTNSYYSGWGSTPDCYL